MIELVHKISIGEILNGSGVILAILFKDAILSAGSKVSLRYKRWKEFRYIEYEIYKGSLYSGQASDYITLSIRNASNKNISDVNFEFVDVCCGDGTRISDNLCDNSLFKNKDSDNVDKAKYKKNISIPITKKLNHGDKLDILDPILIDPRGMGQPWLKKSYNEKWTIKYKVPYLWLFSRKMVLEIKADLRDGRSI